MSESISLFLEKKTPELINEDMRKIRAKYTAADTLFFPAGCLYWVSTPSGNYAESPSLDEGVELERMGWGTQKRQKSDEECSMVGRRT